MDGEKRRMMEAVRSVLSSTGMEFERILDEPAYKLVHRGSAGTWDFIVFADEEKNALSFICPKVYRVEPGHPETLRVLNQINANTLLGKLIFIEEQKTISAVLTIPLESGRIPPELVRRGLSTLIAVVEHVTPYIRSTHGEEEPASEPAVLSKANPANMN